MLKSLLTNSVSRTFIALILAVTAVLGAFLTYVTAPESFGKPDIHFDTGTIYYFADDWRLAYDYLEFKFFPGTLVVPGYHHGQIVAVLIIPPEDYPGELTMNLPLEHRGELPGLVQDNLDQVLIMMNYSDYNNIIRDSGDTILLRAQGIEAEMPSHYFSRQLDHGHSLLTSYDLFGFTNWLLPTPQTVLLRLWGQRLGAFTYYEDSQVTVTGIDFNIQFNHPALETHYYPPIGYQIRSLFYMIFLGLAAASMMAFISGGLDFKETVVKGEYQTHWVTAALAGSILYAMLLHNFQLFFQPSSLGMAALWLLPLLLIIAWAHQARLRPSFFGITTSGLVVGIIAAISVTLFLSLGSTFTLPTGVNWNTSLIASLALATILREALLRGFCQRIISHWLHPLAGIMIVSSAWAVIVVLTGDMNGAGLLLPIVSTLGRSLLIGYLYYRTNNLLATGVLSALLEIAPMILSY